MPASPQLLSDYNTSELASAIVSKTRPYSDLDLSLTVHPDLRDIVPLTDIDAVKSSVRNLVLTNFNERPFQPALGSNLRGLLFEPADKFTIAVLRQYLYDVLAKHEPRIDSVTIQINDNSDNNAYEINLGFRVVNLNKVVDITVYLIRVR